MNEQQIAAKLNDAIVSGQNLVSGRTISTLIDGQSGDFATSLGTIRAVAFNFCTDKCLLVKIDNIWYAIDSNSNKINRSSVHLLNWRRPKLKSSLPTIEIVVGTVDAGGGGGGGGGGN